MNIQIKYQSRGGNTRAAAELIAGALSAASSSIKEPLEEKADLLVLCGGTYAFKADPEMIAFIEALDPEKVGKTAVLVTASGTKHGIKDIRRALEAKGLSPEERELHLPLGTHGLTLIGRTGGSLPEKARKAVLSFAETLKA